jgi:hypothetical protein
LDGVTEVRRWAGRVDFTTADLEALEDGNVLSTDRAGAGLTMTHGDFVQHARNERGTCSDAGSASRTGVRAAPAA